jgi:hypothetical protein
MLILIGESAAGSFRLAEDSKVTKITSSGNHNYGNATEGV